MRDSLTNPDTARTHRRQTQNPPPCNVVLHVRPTRSLRPGRSCGTTIGVLPALSAVEGSGAAPARRGGRSEASRVPASALAFPSHWSLTTRHCTFDRYTCRTKNAVSSSTSSKLPNLIDTVSHPCGMRISPPARPCNTVLRAGSGAPRGEGFRLLPLCAPCYIVLHACTRHQNISTPVSRYFPRNSNPINKTAKISRHVFQTSDEDVCPERSIAKRGIPCAERRPLSINRTQVDKIRIKGCQAEARRYI